MVMVKGSGSLGANIHCIRPFLSHLLFLSSTHLSFHFRSVLNQFLLFSSEGPGRSSFLLLDIILSTLVCLQRLPRSALSDLILGFNFGKQGIQYRSNHN